MIWMCCSCKLLFSNSNCLHAIAQMLIAMKSVYLLLIKIWERVKLSLKEMDKNSQNLHIVCVKNTFNEGGHCPKALTLPAMIRRWCCLDSKEVIFVNECILITLHCWQTVMAFSISRNQYYLLLSEYPLMSSLHWVHQEQWD
jgi:hypothetical protein